MTNRLKLGLLVGLFIFGCGQESDRISSPVDVGTTKGAEDAITTSQVPGSVPFVLDPHGTSHVGWIFATTNWTAWWGSSLHVGDDYYADDWTEDNGNTAGQYTYAMAPGTVIYAGASPAGWGYGNQVVVRCSDNDSFAYRYAHLQYVYVSVGDVVGFDTILGTVGNTTGGTPTSYHLHSVLYKNISSVDASLANLKAGKSPLGYINGHPNSPSKYATPFYNDGIESTGRIVALYAMANSRWVCAENAGAQPLIANRTAVGLWEKFEMIELGGNIVAFRALVNNRYVVAENAGGSWLIANRTAIGQWEKFQRIHTGGGWYAFKSLANNLYVCAESAGGLPLIANRGAIGPWEKFYIYYLN